MFLAINDKDLPCCYLYQHIRLDTNEVFYVGVGKHKNNNA